jgi:adenine-specific DNA-methyltransferase
LVTKKSGFIEGNFDFPKNTDLIKVLLELSGIKANEIVLDFFSGSASTAEAIVEFAIENSLFGISYIMVQLPESTSDSSLPKISDIGKKRIKNVTEHWVEQVENHEDFKCLQGFRSFYLDETNLKIWEVNDN